MKCPHCNEDIPIRSQQANRYYWAVIVKTLSNHTGYGSDECHEILKYKFLQRETLTLGDEKIEVTSTRKLTKEEHQEFCQRIEQWMNQTLNIYLPAYYD